MDEAWDFCRRYSSLGPSLSRPSPSLLQPPPPPVRFSSPSSPVAELATATAHLVPLTPSPPPPPLDTASVSGSARSKAGSWALPYNGRAEHALEHDDFSAGSQLYAWDDLRAAAGPKATAAHSHHREERQTPRRPSTSPLPSSSHRQIGST